jgi:hypothetical protein
MSAQAIQAGGYGRSRATMSRMSRRDTTSCRWGMPGGVSAALGKLSEGPKPMKRLATGSRVPFS